jgi:hypothetical protein
VDTWRRFRNSNNIRPYICYSHGTSGQAILLTLRLDVDVDLVRRSIRNPQAQAQAQPKPKSKARRNFLHSPGACHRSVETFRFSKTPPFRPRRADWHCHFHWIEPSHVGFHFRMCCPN